MTRALAFVLLLIFPRNIFAQPLSAAAQRGRLAMEKAQCNRCHNVSDADGAGRGLEPMGKAYHCVNCHTWILDTRSNPQAIAEQRKRFPDWDRYLRSIQHFQKLPDLGTLTRRVQPAFIRGFLNGPFDLRPHLDESMIPVGLSSADKDAVVRYLTELNQKHLPNASPSTKPAAEAIAEGQKLFVSRACTTCHVFGTTQYSPAQTAEVYKAARISAPLAPNLRYVRDRIPRSALLRYIQDPKAVDPMSTMPNLGVSAQEAERIADFLLAAPLTQRAATLPALPSLTVLPRKVRYDEVNGKVLGKICVHCHMDPQLRSSRGDGGAGNVGGMGFAGAGVNLQTYAGIRAGLLRNGKRISMLEPEKPGELPPLVRVLVARHREALRDVQSPFGDVLPSATQPTPSVQPGMPLGLPPIAWDEIRMIYTWIQQGALEH